MQRPGFFTKNVVDAKYPFEPLSLAYIRAIEQAIRYAWKELMAAPGPHGVDLSADGEVEISEALLRVLEAIRGAEKPPVPAFSEHFETPQSDGSLRNFDGSELSKRPDFCFRLKINPYPGFNRHHYGFFVEAKLIGSDGSIRPYAQGGLVKFLRGQYAWAMSHAMMLGYLRKTGQKLPDALENYFNRLGNSEEYLVESMPRVCSYTHQTPKAYATIHRRTWPYPEGKGSPGNIEIVHLWLNIV